MKSVGTLLWLAIALVASAAEPGGPVTRIGFLSDTHINLRTNEPGPSYIRRLDQAIQEVNEAKVDLVLIAGDETDGGLQGQAALFKQKAKQFQAPVFFVPGNHDVGMAARGDIKSSITHERVKRFGEGLGPNWFVREAAGVRVIGLNSCLFESGLPEEAEQWQFLEQQMAKPLPGRTILLEHYPLFLKSVDEPAKGYWNVGPEPRKRMLQLIKQAGVNTVLSGHLHYPITNRVDGVLFLGNGPTAFGLPKGKQPEGWMLLRVPKQGEVEFEFRRLD
jgi:3',5'-cyclic AMP phosphodiesterase CpdA